MTVIVAEKLAVMYALSFFISRGTSKWIAVDLSFLLRADIPWFERPVTIKSRLGSSLMRYPLSLRCLHLSRASESRSVAPSDDVLDSDEILMMYLRYLS